MNAKILNGKQLAQKVLDRLETTISRQSITPGLLALVVGGDMSTDKFIRLKRQAAESIGINFWLKSYSKKTTLEEIGQFITRKNEDGRVHGILIQLPLPMTLNRGKLLALVDPAKDVDCLHPLNLGYLLEGAYRFLSPVVLAVQGILRATGQFTVREVDYLGEKFKLPVLRGVKVVLVGGGLLVGRPLANFFVNQGATVGVLNEHTPNLGDYTRKADLVITGTNQKDVLDPDQVRNGTVLIDVGNDLVADKFMEREIFLSKNPGGVGPLTIAYLMYNTILASQGRYKAPGAL